jgi:hypothetical protein
MNLGTSGKNNGKWFSVSYIKRHFGKKNGTNFISGAEICHLSACLNNSILKFG